MTGSNTPSLPYFCDPNQLPGPLPSRSEIHSSQLLPCAYEPKYKAIVLVRHKFIVKHGLSPWVVENEGHALLLVGQHLSVAVPRLYAMYREGERLFLVMEFKQGVQLKAVWDSLSEKDKSAIAGQLRDMFTQVRAIPPPASFRFGNVTGGPVPHRFFLSVRPEPALNGPFNDEKDFSIAMAIRSQRGWDSHGYPAWTAEFFARNLPSALSGHASVFTHADLQRKNIIVSKTPPRDANGDGERSQWTVSGVVDWENAGWYPSYWEYAGSFMDFIWKDDWPEKFERIVEPWPLEGSLLRLVRQDLDC
ncbi:phosphotransferase family protein [Trichocladium antarcticum]|uniref:Phosphotransferase family protein n=1 Tax=Trichocladium antarcticum TaxID=1450529 RepID=A0AAN6UGM2_9PEZI|nr:phosphotransferase family protein [Trichocladium antarcticum]